MTAYTVNGVYTTPALVLRGDDTLDVAATGQVRTAGPAITWNLSTAQAGAGVVVTNSGVIAPNGGRAFDTASSGAGKASFTLVNTQGASITAANNVLRVQNAINGGAISIDNAGTFTSTGDRGVNVQNFVTLGSFSFTNRATGVAESKDDLLRLTTSVANGALTGTVLVENAGVMKTVGAGSGQVIDFNDLNPSALGQVVIRNLAGGLIQSGDADAVRAGKLGTVENAGRIESLNANAASSGNDAVDFQDAAGGLVKNLAGGVISGARHGITGKQPVTVENAGLIEGRLGSGINLDTAAASTTVIKNFAGGTIKGVAAGETDGDAVDVDGLVNLDNAGRIETSGTSSAGLTEALAIGGGTVVNSGLIASNQRAITVDNSDGGAAFGAIAITNTGTIQGGSHGAILIVGDRADSLSNSGDIIGRIDMGGGDDVVKLYGGSSTGQVDGGAGYDTVTLLGPGVGMLSALTNLEALSVQGGQWTISSRSDFVADVQLSGGALTLSAVGAGGSSAIQFAAGVQTLGLTTGAFTDGVFAQTIKGFGSGDALRLLGVGSVTALSLGAGNLLTATTASGSFAVQFDATQSFSDYTFVLAADGSGAVISLNGKPVAVADAASVAENMNVTIDVLANDTDPDGNALTLHSVTGGALGGQVSIVGGKVVYSANSDAIDQLKQPQTAVDVITYQVKDSFGAMTTGTVNVTVRGVADAPVRNGTANADTLNGTALEDVLNGLGGNDKLAGNVGADTLDGGAGNDTLSGGVGADRFVFVGASFGKDVISDFDASDVIQLSSAQFANYAAVQAASAQVGADVVITLNAANSITLSGVTLGSLNSGDFLFA